ncbi:LysR family transcriptional regulator [Pseudosulfitobacter sp. DSM 107133]|uniref:LysR family transcriptional regulator n=1 Tax=Pseudosulfitobacter sp. DSM 107133 TaxID=2883100 RepID=UPI000DF1FFC2|nr:LysR family transcriptional regulator [Pseudosulfitobacter sp. DSM 107133]UOA27207.1 HTH-type transcriptional regulator PgrR [Pseudosulfitobacter sp. DSM 107133]
MDRLDAMSILLAVVETGNLSAAGRQLGVPLSTVSRKVSDLEAHLGARLLIRSTRNVSLTETGKAYVVATRRILEDLAEAERAAAGEYTVVKGELVITAPIVFGRLHILPIVTDFLQAYPETDVKLVLADRLLHLADEHVDLALRIATLPDSSDVAVKVGAIRRVVCASPGYVERRGHPQNPAELVGHDIVTFSALALSEAWTFGKGAAALPATPRSRLTVNTAEAAIDAAIAGVGLTRVFSYQIADAIRAGRLVTVLDDHAPDPVPVSLVYRGQEMLPRKLRAFINFATPRLKAAL